MTMPLFLEIDWSEWKDKDASVWDGQSWDETITRECKALISKQARLQGQIVVNGETEEDV